MATLKTWLAKHAGPGLVKALLVAFVAALALVPASVPTGTSASIWREASGHTFSLVGWHLRNLPPRLVAGLRGAQAMSQEEKLALLERYFEVGGKIGRAEAELEQQSALQGADSPEVGERQARLEQLRAQRQALAPRVESLIASDISRVLRDENIAVRSLLGQEFLLPQVIVALQRSPRLLVVSPRDRIERLEDLLLLPTVSVADMSVLEENVISRLGLSALVEGTGGIGTYPTIVDDRSDFYYTFVASAHEWAHNYLSLYPLGQAYFQGGAMMEINEDVADVVGYEIAEEIYRSYGREPPPRPTNVPGEDRVRDAFDFNTEMRLTRQTADQLLADGKVGEAEGYMEERRQLFVANGYYIRKLNQAYFAFHGTYASSGASVSPVGGQVRELRSRFADLSDFLDAVRGVSSYDQFLALLGQQPAG